MAQKEYRTLPEQVDKNTQDITKIIDIKVAMYSTVFIDGVEYSTTILDSRVFLTEITSIIETEIEFDSAYSYITELKRESDEVIVAFNQQFFITGGSINDGLLIISSYEDIAADKVSIINDGSQNTSSIDNTTNGNVIIQIINNIDNNIRKRFLITDTQIEIQQWNVNSWGYFIPISNNDVISNGYLKEITNPLEAELVLKLEKDDPLNISNKIQWVSSNLEVSYNNVPSFIFSNLTNSSTKPIVMNSNKITLLTDGTDPQDGVNFQQLDIVDDKVEALQAIVGSSIDETYETSSTGTFPITPTQGVDLPSALADYTVGENFTITLGNRVTFLKEARIFHIQVIANITNSQSREITFKYVLNGITYETLLDVPSGTGINHTFQLPIQFDVSQGEFVDMFFNIESGGGGTFVLNSPVEWKFYISTLESIDLSEYYTKTETNGLLDLKADQATTYTKTESNANVLLDYEFLIQNNITINDNIIRTINIPTGYTRAVLSITNSWASIVTGTDCEITINGNVKAKITNSVSLELINLPLEMPVLDNDALVLQWTNGLSEAYINILITYYR